MSAREFKIGGKVTVVNDRFRLDAYYAGCMAGLECVVTEGPVIWPQGRCWKVSERDLKGNPFGRPYWIAETDLLSDWGHDWADNEDLRWRTAAKRTQDRLWREKLG